jgi:hypothetical protein
MRSEQEILESINNLRSQLGEDQFTPQSDDSIESIQARVNALDRQLASTPESFSEYVERRKVEDSRSLGDKTAAFTESFMTGAGALAKEGSKAISELFSGDVGASEVGGVFQVGINDFGRFAETLGGAAMDNFYSDENEMQREYQRYKDNFLYNQEVRPAMLETYDEEGRDFVSFGANFVDPTLLVPAAGLIAKGGSLGAKAVATGAKAGAFAARSPRLVQLSKAMAKTSRGAEKVAKGLDKASEVASIPAKLAASGTRKAIKGSALVGSKIAGGVGKAGELTSKVAGLPRAAVTGLASKVIDPKIAGSGILGAQVTGALTGQVPGLGLLTGAEAFGYIANKTGRGVERTLSTLSSTGGQKRFLQRLATTADSPRLRKLALMAHAGGATKLTDLAFNSLVNGASVGALNGALAYASGEGAEGVGAAVGSGTLMGGSLPFGQPGMKGGKSQAARDQSSINFLNAKLADDQIKQFQKLSPEARLAFATVEEAGIRAPKLAFLDKQTYLDFLRQDDPNLRQAPNAHYDMGDNTIYVNQDGNAGRSSKEAMDILTHELGHHFITQGIKDDPLFARKILEQYEAKPGEESFEFAFTTDSAGSPIDSIQLNADAKKISDGYDSIQSGDQSISVGMDANKLAQEIGAEQFAMMMVDNPNIFNTIEPSLRQKLLDGSRKVLTMFGAVDPYTGNPLDISISPILKRNKQVRNLYKNYIKQREKSIVDKVDLAEKGVAIKVRKGESADQAVDRMYGKVFGAKSFSLDDVSGFRINNKKIKKILTDIKNRLVESPEGSLRVERNQIVGKELNKDLKEALLFGDKLGNKNVLLNAMLEGIKNLTEFNFLYRAGKPSKYSDNELRARIVTPFQIRVTGLSPRSKSAASVKMDAYDLAYLRNNVEVLTKEGFTDKPEDLIKEARRVAQQALEDPEGRINPEGNYENELVTAVFGQPESAQFIKNPKLRQLLEDKKLKHSIRSYDVDALAGLVPTGKSGIAFDYFNIKNNYSPFDDKLFMPTEKADGNNNLIPFPKAKSDPAPLPGVKRTFPQQDILDALADKGLISYEAGKNDTVIAKVSTDGYPMPDYLTIYPDGSVEQAKPKLFMPASEAGAGKGKQAEAAKLWQEKGTDSPYFKKWFGKSKVVDENGEPLVVYHGTKAKFNEFERSRGGEFGSGMYFTENIDSAKMFGGFQAGDSEVVTMPAYLTLKNPLITSDRNIPRGAGVKSLMKKGYDGVIGTTPNGQKQYIAFSPEQIKSATGNRGTFDAGERNILFMPTQGDTTPASVQSWDGPNPTFGTNFTKGMVKDNKEAAALLRKSYEDQFGEPLRAQDFTEEQVSWLGDMLAQEGEAALGRTGNAVDWYTSAVERALAVAEEIFPDIGQKYEAKDRFLGALSITSQNMRVMDNAKGAVKQYQHKERTGKFDYSIKHGAKADAITKNLKLYDQAEAKMGAKDLHEFLDTDFTVKELSEWGKGFFGDKKFSIAGYSTDMVKGSAIFGPKIGQGFFQNLRGNYNPVTVDLWLRRTFGRLTGLALDTQLKPGDIGRLIYSVRKNVGKRKFSGLELPEFLKGVAITGKVQGNGVANFKISDQAYNRLFGDNTIGRDNYEAVYEFAGKLNKEWERRFATAGNDVTKAKKAIKAAKKEKKGTANLEKKLAKLEIEKEAIGKEKPQWAKAGSTVSDKLKPIDIPSNAERAVITKAFNVALKTLRDKGIDLTPADLQATLWYPEKDIWAFLKGENSDALNMSYDTAMEVIRDQR